MNERRLRPVLFQFLLPSFLIMLLPFLTCSVFFTLEYYSCRKQAYEKTCRVNEYAQALMKDYLNSYSPGDDQHQPLLAGPAPEAAVPPCRSNLRRPASGRKRMTMRVLLRKARARTAAHKTMTHRIRLFLPMSPTSHVTLLNI